jgi:hypothetical protein
MPILTPDTSAAQDFSKPIDEGTYPARIIKCEARKSRKGNEMIVPTFEVKVNANGQTRNKDAFLVIAGEGAMGFDYLLRAAGFSDLADAYRDPSVQPKPPFDTDSLIGRECQVVIEHQRYVPEGKTEADAELRDSIKTFLRS